MTDHTTYRRPGSEHDDATPPCCYCQDAHIGILVEATLLLRGQYLLNQEGGYAMFVIDPAADLVPLKLPNGQYAIGFTASPVARVAHTECIEGVEHEALGTSDPHNPRD